MGRYISESELKARGIDESKCTRVTKKYALADFYDNKDGDLITASDSMSEIRKSAEQYINDTDSECRLCILRWSDGDEGYILPEMIF